MIVTLNIPDSIVRGILSVMDCNKQTFEEAVNALLSNHLTAGGRTPDNETLESPPIFRMLSEADIAIAVGRMGSYRPNEEGLEMTCAEIYTATHGLGWHELAAGTRRSIGRAFKSASDVLCFGRGNNADFSGWVVASKDANSHIRYVYKKAQ